MLPDFVLDKQTIMVRLDGDEDIFTMMVDMFLQDAESYCTQLADAMAQGDANRVHRDAHTIKGLLATLADEAGAALAFELEKMGKGGDLSKAAALAGDVTARVNEVAAYLRKNGCSSPA